jgi:hypothetical protein
MGLFVASTRSIGVDTTMLTHNPPHEVVVSPAELGDPLGLGSKPHVMPEAGSIRRMKCSRVLDMSEDSHPGVQDPGKTLTSLATFETCFPHPRQRRMKLWNFAPVQALAKFAQISSMLTGSSGNEDCLGARRQHQQPAQVPSWCAHGLDDENPFVGGSGSV